MLPDGREGKQLSLNRGDSHTAFDSYAAYFSSPYSMSGGGKSFKRVNLFSLLGTK